MAYGPNIFAQGMDAFDASYDRTQKMRDSRTRRQAGQALAAGRRQDAADIYGQAGMTDDVRQLQADQQRQEQIDYSRQQDAQQEDIAAQQRKAQVLKQAMMGLKGIPAGQRLQAAHAIAQSPVFQHLGMSPDMLQGVTEEQLSDAALDAATGQIDEHFQGVNLGGGGYGSYDKRTGKLDVLRQPDKPVIVGNGATALDPVTGQPIYSNPKTFAPRAPASNKPPAAVQTAQTLAGIEAELRKRGKLP